MLLLIIGWDKFNKKLTTRSPLEHRLHRPRETFKSYPRCSYCTRVDPAQRSVVFLHVYILQQFAYLE